MEESQTGVEETSEATKVMGSKVSSLPSLHDTGYYNTFCMHRRQCRLELPGCVLTSPIDVGRFPNRSTISNMLKTNEFCP